MNQVQAFDLTRMFLGDQTSWVYLLEILVRTVIMFSWTLLNVRFLGKRNMGQLTPFEFLITFALGSAVGDPMFYPNVPIVHGMLVISTLVALERGLSFLNEKVPTVQKFSKGVPALLIEQGKVLDQELKKQNMNRQDLYQRLRSQGIEDTGRVKYAFLETSGKLSAITYSKEKARQGENTVRDPLQENKDQ